MNKLKWVALKQTDVLIGLRPDYLWIQLWERIVSKFFRTKKNMKATDDCGAGDLRVCVPATYLVRVSSIPVASVSLLSCRTAKFSSGNEPLPPSPRRRRRWRRPDSPANHLRSFFSIFIVRARTNDSPGRCCFVAAVARKQSRISLQSIYLT